MLSKQLRRKYYFKYIILFILLSQFIPLIGIVVTQYKNPHYIPLLLCIFVFVFLVSLTLIKIYNTKYKLPTISSSQVLNDYITYFAQNQLKYLEYTESITWFSKVIHSAFIDKKEHSEDYDKLVNILHRILRPTEDNLCLAIRHKNKFITLSNILYNNSFTITDEVESQITSIEHEPPEKHFFFPWLQDSNFIYYFIVILLHIFGCIILSFSSFNIIDFSMSSFIGNLLICLPTDFTVILLYKGIIKEKC